MLRLDSIAPDLAQSFREAALAQRQGAAQAACEIAVSSSGLEMKQVADALGLLRSGRGVARDHMSADREPRC